MVKDLPRTNVASAPLTAAALRPFVFPVAHSAVVIPSGKGSQTVAATRVYWEGRLKEAGRSLNIGETLLPIVLRRVHRRVNSGRCAVLEAHYRNTRTLIARGCLTPDTSVPRVNGHPCYRLRRESEGSSNG